LNVLVAHSLNASRRHPDEPAEVARQVRLVGEADLGGNPGDALARGQQALRPVDSQTELIAMRRYAEVLPKDTVEPVRAEPCHRRKLSETNRLVATLLQVSAGESDIRARATLFIPYAAPSLEQPHDQLRPELIVLKPRFGVSTRRMEGDRKPHEGRVHDHRVAKERLAAVPSRDCRRHLLENGDRDVHHQVPASSVAMKGIANQVSLPRMQNRERTNWDEVAGAAVVVLAGKSEVALSWYSA
jgi:hypothetical protein